MHPFTETVRFNQGDEGRSIDELEITCNGGLAEIEWYVGNIEPTVPDTGIHINLWMDDHLLSSGLRGSTRGIWNDVPITIRAVVECSPGKHTLEAKLTYVRGSWGIPYVVNPGNEPSTDLIVQRGFVVLEVWDPET